jgi:F-type H+-transporting ATPase subunit gamma
MFLSGEIDRVEVASMRFISAARQSVAVQTLLPLGGLPQKSDGATPTQPVEYEFAPSAQSILDDLLPASFKQRLFKCFLDAAVSEQIARRVTMKAATENADGIIKTISRQYNRARQAQITKEIAEVIGGAAALE